VDDAEAASANVRAKAATTHCRHRNHFGINDTSLVHLWCIFGASVIFITTSI
jgi:hypothetical protein